MNTFTDLKWPLRAAALAAVLASGAEPAAAQDGIDCTTGPAFNLTTQTGDILLPDGNTMYMWGYSPVGKNFQHPGPVLCVTEGDTVTVVLQNTLPEPVSIIFPGQENVLANGVAAQPQFDADGRAISLTNVAPAGGGTVSYSFVATHPGTYLYESGTNPQKQVRMGLFGALVVRPTAGANQADNRPSSQFTPTEEFLTLLSEIDPYQHWAIEANAAASFNFNNYHPRYWLINGRGFPDSIAPNGASWLPTQPYGALARIYPYSAQHPYPAYTHYLHTGSEPYPFHPHANNGAVIGRDGRALQTATGADTSFEKFTINIGPGQTWDVLFKWYDAENYSPTTNPVDLNIPQIANQFFGQFYSFSPYLGQQGPMPPNWSTLNTCGEYYLISHNHALFQISSWGVNMTGPITYMRIDPPQPNNCGA